jgi:hypothetical protein
LTSKRGLGNSHDGLQQLEDCHKLIKQFNIDTLASIENFEFKRESKNNTDELITAVLGCKIRGISKTSSPYMNTPSPYTDKGYMWLKIKGAYYRLEKNQISGWLEFWSKLDS